MPITMSVALLILRLMLGLTLFVHGTQKLFGWFDGMGPGGMMQFLDYQGLKPSRFWLTLAILGEMGGGASVALGFLTPLGAAGILAVMFMAAFKTHWKNGFFATKGGFEYPLSMLFVSLAIGIAGPGAYALDTILNLAFPGILLFVLFAIAGILVDLAGILLSPRPTVAPSESSPKVAS